MVSSQSCRDSLLLSVDSSIHRRDRNTRIPLAQNDEMNASERKFITDVSSQRRSREVAVAKTLRQGLDNSHTNKRPANCPSSPYSCLHNVRGSLSLCSSSDDLSPFDTMLAQSTMTTTAKRAR